MKVNNDYFAKFQKKKTKPFTEREGDWICKMCKNLNFAFRNACNRCKMPKKDCAEIKEQGDNKTKEKNWNNNNNKNNYKYKKYNTNEKNNMKKNQKEINTNDTE